MNNNNMYDTVYAWLSDQLQQLLGSYQQYGFCGLWSYIAILFLLFFTCDLTQNNNYYHYLAMDRRPVSCGGPFAKYLR